jgi:hypothetical protein
MRHSSSSISAHSDGTDNEFEEETGRREYFQELIDAYRANGIVVPTTYNDPGERKSFVNGTVSAIENDIL